MSVQSCSSRRTPSAVLRQSIHTSTCCSVWSAALTFGSVRRNADEDGDADVVAVAVVALVDVVVAAVAGVVVAKADDMAAVDKDKAGRAHCTPAQTSTVAHNASFAVGVASVAVVSADVIAVVGVDVGAAFDPVVAADVVHIAGRAHDSMQLCTQTSTGTREVGVRVAVDGDGAEVAGAVLEHEDGGVLAGEERGEKGRGSE